MTKTQIAAAFWVILTALNTAKANPLSPMGGVPNGHLYAQLMDQLNFDQWTRVIETLKTNGHIEENNFLLTITSKGEGFFKVLDEIFADIKKNTCPPTTSA